MGTFLYFASLVLASISQLARRNGESSPFFLELKRDLSCYR
jgi:hypothetical protein